MIRNVAIFRITTKNKRFSLQNVLRTNNIREGEGVRERERAGGGGGGGQTERVASRIH